MSTAAGQEAEPSKKKARRGSRHVEPISPSHYGPVTCTSAAAALVQAYLATDTSTAAAGGAAQQSPGGGSNGKKGGSSTSSKSAHRTASDSRCFLNMSESTLDPVKRRFGGKSKPVTLAGAANPAAAGVSSGGGGSGSSTKGSRLSFGQGTKIVATKEAVHAALHCRCVFVLLRELCDSSGACGINGGPPAIQTSKSERVDTAHLVTLSPDDLFCALSVDSFPLTVGSNAAGASRAGDGGGSSGRRGQQHEHQQVPVAVGAVPRAFEVADGPAVIHRPAARQGEPWRGLEIFRPDVVAGAWRGQRIPALVGGSRGEGEGGDSGGGMFGDANGGNRGGEALRLDLAAAIADTAVAGATPPLSQEPAAAAAAAAAAATRSKRRAAGCNGLVVCPPGAFLSAAGRDTANGVGDDRAGELGDNPGGCNGTGAAVVALPACVAPAAGGGEAEDAPPPPSRPFEWVSLAMDGEGGSSVSPWRGLPFESKNSLTCLCRAEGSNTGMVSLAPGGGGLVLRSTPPTVYLGMAGGGPPGRGGADAAVGAQGCTVEGGSGGVLLELQGGTLSSSRLLPAPPSAIVSAAVDDAQGVLAVLLADQAGTALLLARDGSDFPVVEQHRGVTAAFKGDFLGNGREQVAFLCSPPTGTGGGSGAGGGRVGKRGSVGAPKATAGGWEQAPLKALVKRALVTDGSFVWENQRREGPRATPSGGGLSASVGADAGNHGSTSAPASASPGANNGPSKGKKRQRSGEPDDRRSAKKGHGESANGSAAAAGVNLSKSQGHGSQDEGHRSDRLSSVVGVLRRRVQAEEARLLRLRQARRGKAAALEAAKLALAAHVGTNGFWSESEALAGNAGGSRLGAAGTPAWAFADGLVAPGGEFPATPRVGGAEEGEAEVPRPPPPPLLRCTIARARFHAPSRALCLDAHIVNPSPETTGDPGGASTQPSAAAVFNVCLAAASASGSLTARSAVCPRLCPGESATVRACVDVPFGLLAGDGGGGAAKRAASVFASCTWTLGEETAPAGRGGRDSRRARSGVPAGACSLVFARVLVSPQDMLGVGGALTSIALAPADKPGQEPSRSRGSATAAAGGRKKGAGSRTSNCGGGGGSTGVNIDKHLGIFDVGTPLDLLLRSDSTATATATAAASLAALPQAVRSLSEVAALPEPWAGGAAVRVKSCSERAAEVTVRAGDAASAPAIILAVAAGALPDGARATADYASEQGRALVAAAAAALRDEMAALEAVARERGLLGASAGAGGEAGAGRGLEAALERYGAAQMRSDVLAARLAGRVVAAGAASRGGGARGALVV